MQYPATICPACATENPRLALFCRRCDQALARRTTLCPICKKPSSPFAEFCKYCGSKLPEKSPPIVPLLPGTLGGWRRRLMRYPFYARMWREGGPGDRNHAHCLRTCDPAPPPDITPRELFELCAFVIPISNRDWCIQRLTWAEGEVTRGELACAGDRFLLLDLDTQRAHVFPYALLESFSFSIFWTYELFLKEQQGIRLAVRHDGGQVAMFQSAEDLLADLAGEAEPIVSMRLRMPPRYFGDERRRNAGGAFWSDFTMFLLQVSGSSRQA